MRADVVMLSFIASTAAITKEIDATMTIVFVVILKVLPSFGNVTGDHRPDWTGRTTG